jgi:hypothetical protein
MFRVVPPPIIRNANILRAFKLKIMNNWIEEHILDVSLNINLEELLYCSAEYDLQTIDLHNNSFDCMELCNILHCMELRNILHCMELCNILHSTLLFALLYLYLEVYALQHVQYLVKPSTLSYYIVNIFLFCCRMERFYWTYKCEQYTILLSVENVTPHLHKVAYIFQQTLNDETEVVKFKLNSHFL